MEKLECVRRHRFRRESRRGSKFLPFPLFMQIVGILHFSALLCARAAAVTGAVDYAAAVSPTPTTTTLFATRGGETVASIATDSSGPEHDEPVLKSSHNERTIAKRRCVTASAGRVGSAHHAQGRASYSPKVSVELLTRFFRDTNDLIAGRSTQQQKCFGLVLSFWIEIDGARSPPA